MFLVVCQSCTRGLGISSTPGPRKALLFCVYGGYGGFVGVACAFVGGGVLVRCCDGKDKIDSQCPCHKPGSRRLESHNLYKALSQKVFAPLPMA